MIYAVIFVSALAGCVIMWGIMTFIADRKVPQVNAAPRPPRPPRRPPTPPGRLPHPMWQTTTVKTTKTAVATPGPLSKADADEIRAAVDGLVAQGQMDAKAAEKVKEVLTDPNIAEQKAPFDQGSDPTFHNDVCPECGKLFTLKEDYVCPECRARMDATV